MRTPIGRARTATFIATTSAAAAAAAAALLAPAAASAATFASGVVSYDSGQAVAQDGYLTQFRNAAAATGSPDDVTGEAGGFPTVLNPFSPPYESDEVVLVGEGGQLTLRLPNFAENGPGRDIGVFTNAGLQDRSFFDEGASPGTNYNPARPFSGGAAEVRVSKDGVTFVSLGRVTFNLPSNYYDNVASPSAAAPPASPDFADFGQPFEGTLSTFDGKNFRQTIDALGGSAGGTWIDFAASGLDRVGFIQFVVSNDTPDAIDRLGIDAVSIANGHVGAVVPEPSALAVLVPAGLALLRRRGRRADVR